MESQTDYPRTRTFYDPYPDYTRPLYEPPPTTLERMGRRLAFLYGKRQADKYILELERILRVHYAHKHSEMLEKSLIFHFL